MSIINQVLLKLDQRRGGRDSTLPDGVRAVAARPSGRRPVILGLLLLVIAGAMGAYGWIWWQQQRKPQAADIKAVSTGKVPGMAQPQKPPEAPAEVFDEDKQLAEIAKKLMDEAGNQNDKKSKLDKSSRKNVVPGGSKKSEVIAEASIAKTEIEPSVFQEASKKPSRESSGRIKLADVAMKSVTPQQQALLHYQKALSLLQQGRVSEARSGLEEALKFDQYLLSARQALASLLVEQKQLQTAEYVLQEGVNLSVEQYGFAMALARLQVERSDNKAALETLFRSLPYATDNAGYQAFLGIILQRSDQHKKAIEHFQAALRLASSGSWQMGLGISLLAENRLGEALEAFNQAKASNELNSDLMMFTEQRIRVIKRQLQHTDKPDSK